MQWVLVGGAALGVLALLAGLFLRGDIAALVRMLRWLIGGGMAVLTAVLMIGGRVGLAGLTGVIAASVLLRGRLGPIDFNTVGSIGGGRGTRSEVRSGFFRVLLDHESGEMAGKVTAGRFAGRDFSSLGEDDIRALFEEIAGDGDSVALLETWLDTNRPDWRDAFGAAGEAGASAGGSSGGGSAAITTEEEACEVLGIAPGASPEDIRAAHRALMKAVHPDQGGSTFLAAKINEAKDFLLRKRGGG